MVWSVTYRLTTGQTGRLTVEAEAAAKAAAAARRALAARRTPAQIVGISPA